MAKPSHTKANSNKKPWHKQGYIWPVIVILLITCITVASSSQNDTNDGASEEDLAKIDEMLDNAIDEYNKALDSLGVDKSDSQQTSGQQETKPDKGIWSDGKHTVLEVKTSSDSDRYFYYLEGKLRNDRTKDVSYIQITLIAYDAAGNTVGSCFDNNSGLKRGGVWSFKALCSGDNIDHFEIKDVTSF